MASPYPPPERPHEPGHGGWSGELDAGPDADGPPTLEFPPAVLPPAEPSPERAPAGGSATAADGGRRTGRIVAVVFAVVVLIGGAGAAMVWVYRHQLVTGTASPIGAISTGATSATGSGADTANGTTTLRLVVGDCVSASALPADTYAVRGEVACGTPGSDLVLARTVTGSSDCADHQYLRVRAGTGVYCFTLDVKPGDCLDRTFLKQPCPAAGYQVIKVEPGPGGTNSCHGVPNATYWVPVGREPVSTGCIGRVPAS